MREIEVTQNHIDTGDPGRSAACPIANAIRDYMSNEVQIQEIQVFTDLLVIYAEEYPEYKTWQLSHEITDWINKFDDEQEVQPITILLGDTYGGINE